MTQEETLEILKMGKNVFLTGPAGSGKTHVLKQYIQYLHENRIPVAVTATTGIAATHMDGRTIHSWAAIGIETRLSKKDLNKLFYNPEIKDRVCKAKVLIIDEISMFDAARFDLVDSVCRMLRENQSPFGGLQVILSGDFFQLAPVPTPGLPPPKFVFHSKIWSQTQFCICYLEEQMRQKDDRSFLRVLNDIRHDAVSEDTVETLMSRHGQSIDGFERITRLYTGNAQVGAMNDAELGKINEPAYTYHMKTDGPADVVRELKDACLAPENLILKKGSLVMFIKNNFQRGYVNGTQGIVVRFDPEDNSPVIEKIDGTEIILRPDIWIREDENGEPLAKLTQIPLQLAWAITIHKSQGMSLDCAEIDLRSAFTEGMGYVALSRVKTLDGIKLLGINETALRVNPMITEFDAQLRSASEDLRLELEAMPVAQKENAWKAFLVK